jgi:hypothetical protein
MALETASLALRDIAVAVEVGLRAVTAAVIAVIVYSAAIGLVIALGEAGAAEGGRGCRGGGDSDDELAHYQIS